MNVSALPTIDPTPEVVTFTITNAVGVVATSVSTVPVAVFTLGVPPGWRSNSSTRSNFDTHIVSLVVIVHFAWAFYVLFLDR